MRSLALKGWGDALLSFINPFASFRLERTGRNCSTLFYCQAFNATNFIISICLSSNLFLLSHQANKARSWRKDELRIRLEISTMYTKSQETEHKHKGQIWEGTGIPLSRGAHIFQKSRRCPKIPGAMKQIPYWGPTSIRSLPTKISCPSDPAPEICTPRTWEAWNKPHAKGQFLFKKLELLHMVKTLRTHFFLLLSPRSFTVWS